MTRLPRASYFFVLVLPYGASFGFVSVAFPFIAHQRGVPVDAISAVVSAAFLPHAPKFLWAPAVDATWSRKTWYLVALALVAAGTFASMAMPISRASLGPLTAVIVASQFGLTLMGMSIEGLLGTTMPSEKRGAAAGWFQAGSFLGAGVGGGAAIELVERFGGPAAGMTIGALLGACALPLLFFDEIPREPSQIGVRRVLRGVGRDLLEIGRSPGGIVALFICVSPIGSGAAGNLFGAIADEWHASLDLVASTTGTIGSLVAAAGAAAGGVLAAKLGRRWVYAGAGALTATAGIAMALAPHTPWTYGLFTLAYQGFNGAAFAAFSALAFDIAGHGAVATKYNVLASLANISIAYTTRVDGAAHAKWGGRGVLVADALMTLAGVALLAIVIALTKPKSPPPKP